MTRARRRGVLTGLLMLACGACAGPGVVAEVGKGTEAGRGTAGAAGAGQADEAGQAFEAGQALEADPGPRLEPNRPGGYLSLGRRLLAANEPALAMRAFSNSMSVEGISVEALTGAGIAAQRQGMLGTARDYLEHARALAPNSATTHGNLGVVLLALRDYHGARTALRSALLLSGEQGNGMVRRHLERAEMSIAAAEAGRHGDPAATQRVVRLGTDAFRLTEKVAPESEGGPGATEPEAAVAGEAQIAALDATANASTAEPATGDATTPDATTGDAMTGDATTGDATTGDATAGATAGEAARTTGGPDGSGGRSGSETGGAILAAETASFAAKGIGTETD